MDKENDIVFNILQRIEDKLELYLAECRRSHQAHQEQIATLHSLVDGLQAEQHKRSGSLSILIGYVLPAALAIISGVCVGLFG